MTLVQKWCLGVPEIMQDAHIVEKFCFGATVGGMGSLQGMDKVSHHYVSAKEGGTQAYFHDTKIRLHAVRPLMTVGWSTEESCR